MYINTTNKHNYVLLIKLLFLIAGPIGYFFFSNISIINQTSYSLLFVVPALTFVIVAIYITYRHCCVKTMSIQKWFCIVAMLLGMSYLIILPPLSTPDESAHYCSSKIIFENSVNGSNNSDGYCTDEDYDSAIANNTQPYVVIYDSLFKNNTATSQKTSIIRYSASTSYVPQYIGLFVAKLFHVDNLMTLYLGSFSSLIIYILISWLAIKIVPFGKQTLAYIALFPLCLQIAGSYSYDVSVLCLSFLVVSYSLFLIYSKKSITFVDIILYAILSIFLQPTKEVYIFFWLLLLLIPASKFSSKRNRILFLIFTALATIIPVLPKLYTITLNILGFAQANLSNNGNGMTEIATYSVGYYLSHPLFTIGLYSKTFVYWLAAFLPYAIGRSLGSINIHIPYIFVIIMMLLLVLSLFSKDSNIPRFKRKETFTFIIISLLITLSLFTVLAITWTEVGSIIIQGIQGRYFTPFIFLILLIFTFPKIKLPEKFSKLLPVIYVYSHIFFLLISFFTILNR